jgi:hypothetical protein
MPITIHRRRPARHPLPHVARPGRLRCDEPGPDYSCADVVLKTDGAHEECGLTFTCSRGTEVVVIALFLLMAQPGTSGVLATLRLPNGSEYMVTQRCNWSLEPYTVSFYIRSPGRPWGWCYIDHQADRWRDVRMTYNEAYDTIMVTERGKIRGSLNRRRSTFENGAENPRGVSAPQEYRQPEFAFQ